MFSSGLLGEHSIYIHTRQLSAPTVSTSCLHFPLHYPTTTMASLWYCCGCSFGPHNSALYDACISCGTMRCSMCIDEKVANRLSSHAHSHSDSGCGHTTSPYPMTVAVNSSPVSLDTRAMPSSSVVDLPQIQPLLRQRPAAPALPFEGGAKIYSQTYMYICCKCQDGPKVYDVQPQCVICHHEACSSCVHVK